MTPVFTGRVHARAVNTGSVYRPFVTNRALFYVIFRHCVTQREGSVLLFVNNILGSPFMHTKSYLVRSYLPPSPLVIDMKGHREFSCSCIHP